MILFGRTDSVSGDRLSVTLDNGTKIHNAIYTGLANVGDRVAVVQDRNRWLVLTVFAGNYSVSSLPGSSSIPYTFLGLSDTPSSFSPDGYFLVSDGTKLVFQAPDPTLVTEDDLVDFLVSDDIQANSPLTRSVSGNTVTLGLNAALISHSDLDDLDADDHAQYAHANGSGTRSAYSAERLNKDVEAGSGLSGGGTLTSDVSLAIELAAISGLTLAGDVLAVNDSIAGAGLGMTDKVISVGEGDGISTNSYQISVDSTVARDTWPIIAGAGLTDGGNLSSTGVTLNIGDGFGIIVNADSIEVDQTEDYTWTGIHHFDGTVQVDTNLDFIGTRSITATGDITFEPDASVLIPNDIDLSSTSFDSSTPIEGWRIQEVYSGFSNLTIGSIAADELSVRAFVADETRIDRGDEYWTKSYGILSEGFTVPSVSGTVSVTFEDSPAITGAIFSDNDWLLFRKVDVGTGLSVVNIYGQVSGYIDNEDGTQTWTYTHRSGTVGTELKKGTIGIDFGQSGAAIIHLSVIDSAGSPYLKLRRWSGSDPYSPSNFTTYVQLGDLDSLGSIGPSGSQYTPSGDGIYIRSTGSDGQYVVADDNGLRIRGALFSMYSGSTEVFRIDPSAISLALGDSIPENYTDTGIWMGLDSGSYKMSVGNSTDYMRWDGTNVTVAGTVYISNPGDINTNDITDGAGLGTTAVWSSISSIPVRLSDTPSGSGLFLSSDHMGFYDTAWKTYIDIDGNALFSGSGVPSDLGDSLYHGLWWDASENELNIYGNLNISHSVGYGDESNTGDGGQVNIADYGLIDMGSNSKIAMGANSEFSADANSIFSIGELDGDYIRFINGVLTISGRIIVKSGGDVEANKYSPKSASLWANDTYYNSTHLFLFGGIPYCGFAEMRDGRKFYLIDDTGGVDTNVSRESSRHVVFFVHKDGTGITNSQVVPSRDYWGIDNYGTHTLLAVDTEYAVDVIALNHDVYVNTYSDLEKENHILVGHAYLNGDLSGVEYANGAGESGSTIIGPGYVITDYLSSISANLGEIDGGKATFTNGDNTLWVNNGTSDIVLAAGNTDDGITSAYFKVWANGSMNIGSVSDGKYINWNSSTGSLMVKGDVRADAGYLGALDISGNLTMNGGKIQWNRTNSFIDDTKIYISETGTKSLVRIGDTSVSGGGIIDIDLFEGASSAWTHGIHIADGGNRLNSASSLYHGESNDKTTFVDRIFDARTYGNSRSDGFYGEMNAYDNGTDWDAQGAVFKGRHLSGGPVALFSQHGTSGSAPAVWIDSAKVGATLFKLSVGGASQTAISIDGNGYSPIGISMDGTKIDMGYGRIEKVSRISLQNGGGVTGVAVTDGGLGTTVLRWQRIEIEGVGTFSIPLFHESKFN